MYKSTIRSFSTSRLCLKEIPYVSKPRNKYNAERSTFNFKPHPTLNQGLIHNPSQSAPNLKKTPKAFLPANDPRRTINSVKHKTYSIEELNDMPLIHGYNKEKTYEITPEIVKQIIELRNEDPIKWTISTLAKKFELPKYKVNVISGVSEMKQKYDLRNLQEEKLKWHDHKLQARLDRVKRNQLSLRNEY